MVRQKDPANLVFSGQPAGLCEIVANTGAVVRCIPSVPVIVKRFEPGGASQKTAGRKWPCTMSCRLGI